MVTRIHITGIVQGVGFRPFLYNLAGKYKLKGFCLNDTDGLLIEVKGDGVEDFIREIESSPPPLARIDGLDSMLVDEERAYSEFSIRESLGKGAAKTLVSPDTALCTDCLREMNDPGDRRYRYPFINCTNCGPRYSIVIDVPYDRPSTTMARFTMCDKCMKEYTDPTDRRFHAQPNACPRCGPEVELAGTGLKGYEAIEGTLDLIGQGKIVAIKGLGGFHLSCDATNDEAIERLRQSKRKSNKPFAVMAADVAAVEEFCHVSPVEKRLLIHRASPIVLLRKKEPNALAAAVSPDNGSYGAVLPYTPLHHLLFSKPLTGRSVILVMTSGNLAEEPIVISNHQAQQRLASIADAFLIHDRDIYMRVDDSIVRVRPDVSGESGNSAQIVRRARGFAPEPIDLGEEMDEILALGPALKNTFCLTKGTQAILSQHIGDLDNIEAVGFLKETLGNLKNTFRIAPTAIAHDMHPDYPSSIFAREYAETNDIAADRVIPVQHHHAHVVSCMAENNLFGEVIGVAFDGMGLGIDGAVWGGEFLLSSRADFIRAAHLAAVPQPGGDAAAREPWRMALAYLYSTYGADMTLKAPALTQRLNPGKIRTVIKMMERSVNTPLSTSAGRLFDAVSSLLGLRDVNTFEGEAAMTLEKVSIEDHGSVGTYAPYTFDIATNKDPSNPSEDPMEPFIIDTRPLIAGIVEDTNKGAKAGAIGARFHVTMAEIIVAACTRIRGLHHIGRVVLTGGVFQNALLERLAACALVRAGFSVFTHSLVPANDGGVSLGQAVIAWERLKARKGLNLKQENNLTKRGPAKCV